MSKIAILGTPEAEKLHISRWPKYCETPCTSPAESGVLIEEKDVQKKSKPEAYLVSYKISVKAEDLQVALNPSVWPLRVKVREFIHYSKRPPRQPRDQQQGRLGQQYQQGDQQDQPHRQDLGQGGAVQQGGGRREQGGLPVTTNNRFAVLDEGSPGTQPV